MTVTRVTAVMASVAAATALSACGGSGSASTGSAPLQHPSSLVGDVGHNDEFHISLTDPTGNPIRHLAAGTYSLSVNDESQIHDFHLSGSGVDRTTSVPGTGKQSFSVTFRPGTYTFVCDPHASQMRGTFTVS